MARTPGVCTICFGQLKGTLTTYATCGHKYHKDCYCTWICSNKGSELLCSKCRGPLCQSQDEWLQFALQKLPPDDRINKTGKSLSLQERLMAAPRPSVQQQEAVRLLEKLSWINEKLKADAFRPQTEYEKKLLTLRSTEERPLDKEELKQAAVARRRIVEEQARAAAEEEEEEEEEGEEENLSPVEGRTLHAAVDLLTDRSVLLSALVGILSGFLFCFSSQPSTTTTWASAITKSILGFD